MNRLSLRQLLSGLVLLTAILVVPHDLALAQTATMSAAPAASTLNVGDNFGVTVNVNPGGVNVNVAEVHLTFNPAHVQVLTLTPGSTLPLVVKSVFDNTTGQVDYAAGIGGSSVATDFTLVTVVFTAISPAIDTPFTIRRDAFPNRSQVLRIPDATDILATVNHATVTISGPTSTPTSTFTPAPPTPGATCGALSQEAEAGMRSNNMQQFADANASGGQYISVPEGAGSFYDTPSTTTAQATFCFTITTAGTYRIVGRVLGADTSSDSFFVQVAGGAINDFMFGTSTDYIDHVLGGATPVTFNLPAGNTQVIVYGREDGTRLDTLRLELIGGPDELLPTAQIVVPLPETPTPTPEVPLATSTPLPPPTFEPTATPELVRPTEVPTATPMPVVPTDAPTYEPTPTVELVRPTEAAS